MSVGSTLAQGREAAEARMNDSCTITKDTGLPVWNPSTGVYDDPQSTVYSGKCRVKAAGRLASEPDAGDRKTVVIRPGIHIPATVQGVGVGNTVMVTAAEFNPSLVGAVFRVTSLFRDSQATAQRLECTEVQL